MHNRVREELDRYFGGILQNLSRPVTSINSVEDQVHLLFELDRMVSVSKGVEEIKKSSSKWIKTKGAGCTRSNSLIEQRWR